MSEELLGIGFGLGLLISLMLVVMLVVIFVSMFVRKSKTYRKTLADLYIAGKIKQIAKEDSIDLVEEFECFKKWLKKLRIEETSLDITIEEELQEKITERKDKK